MLHILKRVVKIQDDEKLTIQDSFKQEERYQLAIVRATVETLEEMTKIEIKNKNAGDRPLEEFCEIEVDN